MIKIIKNSFHTLDNKIKIIMKIGLLIALLISIISSIILVSYILFNHSLLIYYIGIYTFKFSISIGVGFIICGYVMDGIKNGY